MCNCLICVNRKFIYSILIHKLNSRFDRRVVIRNKEDITLNNRSKSKKASQKGEAESLGQLLLQIYGEKKNTDLFALKDAKTNENDLDEFSKTENDIGKVFDVPT